MQGEQQLSKILVGILLVASAAVYLTHLGQPEQVIFDEVHFGKFITAYCCTGERFFDIHPPHGKLAITLGAWLGGYEGDLSFEHIGQPYEDTPAAALRIIPALAGAVLPLILFVLLRQVGTSPWIAFAGGLAAICNNALVVQSRLIALDSQLLLATFGALVLFWASDRFTDQRTKYTLLAAAGAAAGYAAGVKFTGLAALGILGVIVLYRLWKRPRERTAWIGRGAAIAGAAIVVYLAGWWVHYALLPNEGSGRAWQDPTGNFVSDVVDMHQTMFDANYNLKATHPYSSMWWTWPIMGRPIFYWSGSSGAAVYFIGNPVVWWGFTALFVVALLALVGRHTRSVSNPRAWAFLAGYLIAYVPLMRVPRALFLYHYLTPLLFSMLFSLSWLDARVQLPVSWRKLPTWYVFAGMLIVGSFVLFAPLTYGFESAGWQALTNWFDSWR